LRGWRLKISFPQAFVQICVHLWLIDFGCAFAPWRLGVKNAGRSGSFPILTFFKK
jgi:hypothetical protein